MDFPLIRGVLINRPVAQKHFIIKVNNANKNTSIGKQVPRLEQQNHAQDLKKVNFNMSLLKVDAFDLPSLFKLAQKKIEQSFKYDGVQRRFKNLNFPP